MLVGFHELFYDGLTLFLKKYPKIELVANAPATTNILRLLKTHIPDVVIVNTRVNGPSTFDITSAIYQSYPAMAVIAYLNACEEALVAQQIKAGAKGILFVDCSKEEFVKAIRAVFEKRTHYCATSTKSLVSLFSRQLDPRSSEKSFSDRELSIIKLICKEYKTREIAAALSLSLRTVEEHRTTILKKIGAKNVVGIAVYALQHKFV